MKAEVKRLEAEQKAVGSRAAPAQEWFQRFAQTVAPYRALIEAEGGKDPLEGLRAYLQTAYAFRTASPDRRAAMAIQTMGQYQVDPALVIAQVFRAVEQGGGDVNTLIQRIDHAYQGRGGTMGKASPFNEAELLDKAERRLLERLEGTRHAQLTDDYHGELADLAGSNEFLYDESFPELREDMARAIENELADSFEEAFDVVLSRAKYADLREVIQQRAQAQRSTAPNVTRAKRAASSIRSSPVGGRPASPPGKDDRKADIRASIAELMGG